MNALLSAERAGRAGAGDLPTAERGGDAGDASLWTLLAPRRLATAGAFRRGRGRTAILGASTLGFWAGSFLFFERVLAYFQSLSGLGPLLTQRLLLLLFASFFAILVISNVVTALTTFYLAPEVNLLLAAPLSRRQLHHSRFVDTLLASSWMVLLFGLPAFLAYGVVYEAGPGYYLATVAVLVPFLVIPCAIGILLTTALVIAFPARAARDSLVVAVFVALAGGFVALRLLRPERLAQPAGLEGFAGFLVGLGAPASPWLPSTWAAEVLVPMLGARAGTPLFFWALLATTAGVAFLASAAVVDRLFLVGWSRAQEGRGGDRTASLPWRVLRTVTRVLPSPLRHVLVKDAVAFLRDPGQWSQLVILAALVVIYVYNFSSLPLDDDSALGRTLRDVASFCNLGLSAFVVTAVAARFVFPSVSLEGQAWWLLRTAPVSLTSVWWSKFWIGFVPLATLAVPLVTVTNAFLGVPRDLTLVFVATMLPLVAALVSLGLAFGSAYPRFDTRNAAQIATGFGAIVYMVTSLALIGAVVALLAWPVSRLFWRGISLAALTRAEMALVAALALAVVLVLGGTWEIGRRVAIRRLGELAPG